MPGYAQVPGSATLRSNLDARVPMTLRIIQSLPLRLYDECDFIDVPHPHGGNPQSLNPRANLALIQFKPLHAKSPSYLSAMLPKIPCIPAVVLSLIHI